jgi:hypothetical protein
VGILQNLAAGLSAMAGTQPEAPPEPGSGGGSYVDQGEVKRTMQVKLDSNGNGQVQFAVQTANQQWLIYTVVCQTNQAQTAPPYPQVTAYLGGQPQAGLAQGASWIGNQVTLAGKVRMDSGLDLIIAFAGGVAGSVATVTIEGDNQLWR